MTQVTSLWEPGVENWAWKNKFTVNSVDWMMYGTIPIFWLQKYQAEETNQSSLGKRSGNSAEQFVGSHLRCVPNRFGFCPSKDDRRALPLLHPPGLF